MPPLPLDDEGDQLWSEWYGRPVWERRYLHGGDGGSPQMHHGYEDILSVRKEKANMLARARFQGFLLGVAVTFVVVVVITWAATWLR